MSKIVYADNAATTFLSKHALGAMMPYLTEQPGNPSTVYSYGRTAKRAIEEARGKVAAAIGAKPEEIYFTGGGTEADNWAIKAAAELKREKGRHIISTEIEHHAVQHTLQYLEKLGYEVTYLKVDSGGNISLEDLRQAIRKDTILITVMMANNEIGTILPISEIGKIAREAGILFHTDAVQAAGHIPVNVSEMKIDMLSLTGHKFKGPKGTGALYIKKGLRLPTLLHGGGQERGVRSGTENVPGIVGLGAALEEAAANLKENSRRVTAMRDNLIEGLLTIPYTHLTGDTVNRLPGIASFVFECVEGESMVLLLDQNGICASSGSACSSGSLDPSHVLLAIGLPHEVAHGSLRLSLNEDNTDEDINIILEKMPKIITRLRDMSPVWEDKLAQLKHV
jgi:cysteine desulfurase